MKRVHPENLRANGLWNIFTGLKKYRITCGDCKFIWDQKVPFARDDPRAVAICPACGTVNEWSHKTFDDFYTEEKARLNNGRHR